MFLATCDEQVEARDHYNLKTLKMESPGGNGGGKSCNLFNRQSVNYPVKFDLKVIIEASMNSEDSITDMEKLFNKHEVPFSNWRQKSSSAAKYISYAVNVDIASNQVLEKLYADLNKVRGVKFVL